MEGFYVMAFATVSASLRAEKMALGRFRTVVIPTPGEISRDCGFALRFLDGGREDGNIMLIVTAGFWLINLVAFDMMENILAGRAKAEKMRLSAERNRNQMEIYRSLMSTKNISGSIRSSSPGLMYPTVRRLYHFMITTIIC